MYLKTNNEYECSGCTACENICKHKAITMKENDEGFLYPVLNAEKCIQCGMCERICPMEHPMYIHSTPKVFAAYNKKERRRSSSGGLFYIIAKHVIEKGGVVFGAAYDDNLKVVHVCAKTLKDIQPLRNSKYVQSNLGKCFLEVKSELDSGKLVYFSGVGCQVAGLYAFLRKDYSNLLTSDIVCHGCPSQKVFDEHLKFLAKKYDCPVKKYSFRDEKYWLIREKAIFDNGSVHYEMDGNNSPYLLAFGLGYMYRYSCFKCPFAKIPRQGDISLADYWGVNSEKFNINPIHGVSLVLLNSKKSIDLWEQIKDQLVVRESTLSECVKNNPNVVRPSREPQLRKSFYKMLSTEGYSKMTHTILKCPASMRYKLIERIMKLRQLHIYQPYDYLRVFVKRLVYILRS